jgi:proteic killer suppression protein
MSAAMRWEPDDASSSAGSALCKTLSITMNSSISGILDEAAHSNRPSKLNAAQDVKDLRSPPGNRLEALKGNLAGYYSIRINDQFRIIFRFANGAADDVEIVDYH